MAQKYNTSFKLGNKDRNDHCKVYIRVTGNGVDIKIPTIVKVPVNDFLDGKVINRDDRKKLNAVIEKKKREVDDRILDAELRDMEVTADYFSDAASSKDSLKTYIKKFTDAIKNESTRRSRKSILGKLPDMKISEIRGSFLKEFEDRLWSDGLDQNTIHTQLVRVKTLILRLIKDEYIKSPKIIKALQEYMPPAYLDKVPEYLTVAEIEAFAKLVNNIHNEQKRTAGFYFLLSCFTGWRLKDLVTFDYEQRVKNGNVTLRASKNNKIVSIPVYPGLREVLSYCKDNHLNMTEQHFRLYVKQIASDIGIPATRNIKIHTGRHSFAMMLLEKGFSIDEVGEFLGDTPEITRIYARINNRHLGNRVKALLG